VLPVYSAAESPLHLSRLLDMVEATKNLGDRGDVCREIERVFSYADALNSSSQNNTQLTANHLYLFLYMFLINDYLSIYIPPPEVPSRCIKALYEISMSYRS